jgi:hypothetical protein
MQDSTIERIGCDVGDKTSALYVLSADGRSQQLQVKTTPTGLSASFVCARRNAKATGRNTNKRNRSRRSLGVLGTSQAGR